jgi:hypothetical protein
VLDKFVIVPVVVSKVSVEMFAVLEMLVDSKVVTVASSAFKESVVIPPVFEIVVDSKDVTSAVVASKFCVFNESVMRLFIVPPFAVSVSVVISVEFKLTTTPF